MTKLRICVLVCSALLAGCAVAPAEPPVIQTKAIEAKVIVSTPCVSAIPSAPDLLSDRDLLTGTGKQVADQLWADHLEQRDYIGELVAALTGCMAPQSAEQSALPKLEGVAFK
jgi:hypothetical protein